MNRKKQILLAMVTAAVLVAMTLIAGLRNPEEPTTTVVSAKIDVPAGTVILPSHLDLVELPQRLMTSGYLKETVLAVGQSTDRDLKSGQLLDSRWLHGRPEGIVFPEAAADGRLYTLRLPAEHANGFWLAAGNLVDIHLIPKGDPSPEIPDLLPDIRIASLIGTGQQEGSGSAVSVLPGPASTGNALVCLNVNSAQAHLLAQAETRCIIKLVPVNEPPVRSNGKKSPDILEASYPSSQARFG